MTVWAVLLFLTVAKGLAQERLALVDGVDAIGITVTDMDRAVDFYSRALTLTRGAESVAQQLRAESVTFVSSGVVANHTGQLEFSKGFLLRDPDGHAIEIEEK